MRRRFAAILVLCSDGDVERLQKSGGVLEESIHQDVQDPHEVLVLHRFANAAAAEAFASNHDLAEAMKRGGVDGPPRIEIYEDGKR